MRRALSVWRQHCHFSGGIRGQGGVAVILNKKLRGSMISYNPVSERILVVRVAMRPVNVKVIQVYAPTTTHSEEELDTQLQTVKDGIRTRRDTGPPMRGNGGTSMPKLVMLKTEKVGLESLE